MLSFRIRGTNNSLSRSNTVWRSQMKFGAQLVKTNKYTIFEIQLKEINYLLNGYSGPMVMVTSRYNDRMKNIKAVQEPTINSLDLGIEVHW